MKKTYLKKDESESVDVTPLYDEDHLCDEEENALDKEIKLIINTLNCEKKHFQLIGMKMTILYMLLK